MHLSAALVLDAASATVRASDTQAHRRRMETNEYRHRHEQQTTPNWVDPSLQPRVLSPRPSLAREHGR